MSNSQNNNKCFNCGKELSLPAGNVPRTEECPHCRSDVRVCYNCRHYDPQSYNECSEPMAERVVNKDKRNFCEYFNFSPGGGLGKAAQAKEDALKKLNDLFKK